MSAPPARTDRPTVLLVDDCRALVETYEALLADDYDVRTATDGRGALEQLDGGVDALLLDRQLPDLTGREVVSAIRNRGLSCRLALVSAIDPRLDDREMAVDEYLVKPVSGTELQEMVERLATRAAYDRALRRSFALASNLNAREGRDPTDGRVTDGEYPTTRCELDALQTGLDSMVEGLADRDLSDEWNYYPSPSD